MKSFKHIMAAILTIVMIVSANGTSNSRAQGIDEQINGVQLVDIPLHNDYVMSLPKDWLVWKSEDYRSVEDGIPELVKILQQVNPTIPDSNAQNIAKGWSTLTLLALRPT